MKELEPTKDKEPQVQIVQDVKITPRLIGSLKKIKGLTVFEFNPIEMTLEPAKYKETTVSLETDGLIKIVSTIIANPECYYVQALNKANAYKKVLKFHRNHQIHHGNTIKGNH